MSAYTISIDYAVQNDTTIAVSNTSISPSPPDANKESSTVDYRVGAEKGSTKIWSDPSVKNSGN